MTYNIINRPIYFCGRLLAVEISISKSILWLDIDYLNV